VGAREDDDDDDDVPATSRPELPPEDAGFLALGIDEVEDEPEHDTPAMERARERHNAGNDVYDKPAKLACYYEALGCLRGTTVPFPELLLDIAVCHKGYPRDPAPRPFAEAAAVRFERRARRSKAGADSLFQLARAYALAGRQPAMIQALKQWIPLHASNAGKVKECAGAKITTYVPAPESSKQANKGMYTKLEFGYDAERDAYLCPNQQWLVFLTESHDKGQLVRYYANSAACRGCPLRAQCTSSKEGRRISRRADEPWAEAMEVRVQARPELQQQRKCMVEHPFGTMKRGMDFGYFLLKGLMKVRGEFSLMALSYNLRRVINVLGVECLLKALRTRRKALQGVLTPA